MIDEQGVDFVDIDFILSVSFVPLYNAGFKKHKKRQYLEFLLYFYNCYKAEGTKLEGSWTVFTFI